MKSGLRWGLVGLALAAACSRSKESEEQKPAEAPTRLGSLDFPVTGGTPAARAHFERGLLALHSFWYDEANREFQAAIDADRRFSMAYWGLAMSKAKLLWGDDQVGEARAILARLPRPDQLSAREKAWLKAARALFGEGDVRSSRRAFAAAMDKLHAAYPDDESATFLAVALIATIHPGDPDEAAVRERAAALAGEVFARNPKHPGAAHYLIHACDTAELAERALPAARTYADIAPEAFHARHMPAHIFSRLGMWKEAITSCQAAWDASVAAAARHRLGPEHHDFHSLSWLVEMNFELGKRRAADAAMKQFGDAVRAGLSHQNRTAYVQQVVSYLGRSGEWKRVEELLAPLEAPAGGEAGGSGPAPAPRPAESPPGAASCTEHAPAGTSSMMELFERRAVAMARARAAAGLRDVASTQRRLDEVAAIDVELHEILIQSQPPELVARQEETNDRSSRALLARARGDDRALLAVVREMRAAGWDPGGEVPLSAFLHAEGEADALLALGRAGEALTVYREVLRENRGRARSMLGAARAAQRAGQQAEARAMYEKLLAQWADAEEGTEGLAEARAAVSRPSRAGQ